MRYIEIVKSWILKKRTFKDEFLMGLGLLFGLLFLIKIIGRLIVGDTFLGLGGLILVLIIYSAIVFLIRLIEVLIYK